MDNMEKNETNGPNETVTEETAEAKAAEETVQSNAAKDAGEESQSNNNQSSDLQAVLAERDEYKDKYLRLLAEFNNYKKRTASTRTDAIRDGQCDVIAQILPVLDNLERALEHIEEGTDNPMAQGIQMVQRQLVETLEKLGIKEIPALGEPFNPNLHQAVQMVDTAEGQTPGNVSAVLLKGYMTDDRVIRHSMVIVNK